MQVSKEFRRKLVNELQYCADKMSKEKDLRKKVFFLSNAEDAVTSTLDFEYDPQLVLIELILDTTIGTISYRIDTIKGEDTSVDLIEGLFDKLYSCLNELAISIEENRDTYKTLERMAELAHTTTERGYYLYTRGLKAKPQKE